MASSMVQRRVVGYAKGKRKPSAPQPQKVETEKLIGERAKPFMLLAAPVPRVLKKKSWWSRIGKPLAIFGGTLLSLSIAAVIISRVSNTGSHDYDYSAADYRTPQSTSIGPTFGSSRGRGQNTSSQASVGTAAENPMLPTDESFRASAYVRKKVYLPHISGSCVIKGSASQDIGACLHREEARTTN